MAAQDISKSSKSSFMNNSPKPKQASILNFFGTQKQETISSSPLSKIVQSKVEVLEEYSPSEIDNIPSEYIDESFEFLEKTYNPKKKFIPEENMQKKFNSKNYEVSGVIAPKILNELNEAASCDFEQPDGSFGRYQWLIDIKDINMIPKGEPGYDARTLYIPESAWSKFTPFEKQFWDIKAKFFDTIVFFKKGKFFELYENDADVGAKEFNLKMTDRVNMRMVGVPEATFDYWAAKFVGKGHKVAKVDQLENAISKTMREKSEKSSKADKIIRRELTSILTCGTLVDGNHLKTNNSNYCISFKISEISGKNGYNIGAAFLDASSAKFYVVDFEDDSSLIMLSTMLAQISPKEIIVEKSVQNSLVIKFIKSQYSDASFVYQDPIKEFWDHIKTADEIEIREYFGSQNSWPECLVNLYNYNKLSFSAFGSLVSYLRVLKLDYELLSYGDVSLYEIMKQSTTMIVDGHAVDHLSVCSSSQDQRNTLLGIIDRCSTPFGHRRLRSWIMHPLYLVSDIKSRQEGISCLIENFGCLSEITKLLKTLPDLERLCTRIHAGTLSIKAFVNVLNGFKTISSLKKYILNESNLMCSAFIRSVIAEIPDFKVQLEFFFSSFDEIVAQRDGVLDMTPGSFSELDIAKSNILEWERKFDSYLKEQEIRLRFKPLKYKDIGKEIFQIEMPVHVNVPNEFMVLSKTKAVKRYWTPDLRKMVNEYLEAKEVLSSTQESGQAVLYKKFSSESFIWRSVINSIASLDCLCSLALFSKSIPEPRCQPQLIENSAISMFEASSLRHPIVACYSPNQFVSNDIKLSSDPKGERVMILTGANMGGKSTLLRQVGLVAILAQLGAWVPSEILVMTPFDRIFTRLGANDNIIGGESTFKVELSETSKILRECTSRSLVIIDELGRGTSTFDGVSIAEAVLHYLIEIKKPCILFSTHYNMICDTFSHTRNVGLFHLNCFVNEEKKTVTFLYKLVRGVSPKSYGIHVAHMAGIPIEIIENAAKYSNDYSCSETVAGNKQILSSVSLLIMKKLFKA